MDKLPEARSAWDSPDAAWPVFAGILLGLLGVFNVIEGLLTLFNDRYGGLIGSSFFFFNLKGWGWLHLLLGLALLAVCAAMFIGMDWAPSIAVGLAGATAIFQMIYMDIIPTWSLVNVAIAILLIYILVIKGHDVLGVIPRPQAVDDRAASDKARNGEALNDKTAGGRRTTGRTTEGGTARRETRDGGRTSPTSDTSPDGDIEP